MPPSSSPVGGIEPIACPANCGNAAHRGSHRPGVPSACAITMTQTLGSTPDNPEPRPHSGRGRHVTKVPFTTPNAPNGTFMTGHRARAGSPPPANHAVKVAFAALSAAKATFAAHLAGADDTNLTGGVTRWAFHPCESEGQSCRAKRSGAGRSACSCPSC
ncbi:hypothetical protein GCM10010174_82350 [Kutzneria viridogrisea]